MRRMRCPLTLVRPALMLTTTGLARTPLTYWHGFTGPDRPYMEQLIKQFNDSHPDIEVKAQAQEAAALGFPVHGMLGEVRIDSGADGRVEDVGPELIEQLEALQLVLDGVFHFGEA